jgi:hypothetical protein
LTDEVEVDVDDGVVVEVDAFVPLRGFWEAASLPVG